MEFTEQREGSVLVSKGNLGLADVKTLGSNAQQQIFRTTHTMAPAIIPVGMSASVGKGITRILHIVRTVVINILLHTPKTIDEC